MYVTTPNGVWGLGMARSMYPSSMGGPLGMPMDSLPNFSAYPTKPKTHQIGYLGDSMIAIPFGKNKFGSSVVYQLTPGGYTTKQGWGLGYGKRRRGLSIKKRKSKSKSKKSKRHKYKKRNRRKNRFSTKRKNKLQLGPNCTYYNERRRSWEQLPDEYVCPRGKYHIGDCKCVGDEIF